MSAAARFVRELWQLTTHGAQPNGGGISGLPAGGALIDAVDVKPAMGAEGNIGAGPLGVGGSHTGATGVKPEPGLPSTSHEGAERGTTGRGVAAAAASAAGAAAASAFGAASDGLWRPLEGPSEGGGGLAGMSAEGRVPPAAFPFVPAHRLGMWPDGLEGARFAPRPLPSRSRAPITLTLPPPPMLAWRPAALPSLDVDYDEDHRPAAGEESTERLAQAARKAAAGPPLSAAALAGMAPLESEAVLAEARLAAAYPPLRPLPCTPEQVAAAAVAAAGRSSGGVSPAAPPAGSAAAQPLPLPLDEAARSAASVARVAASVSRASVGGGHLSHMPPPFAPPHPPVVRRPPCPPPPMRAPCGAGPIPWGPYGQPRVPRGASVEARLVPPGFEDLEEEEEEECPPFGPDGPPAGRTCGGFPGYAPPPLPSPPHAPTTHYLQQFSGPVQGGLGGDASGRAPPAHGGGGGNVWGGGGFVAGQPLMGGGSYGGGYGGGYGGTWGAAFGCDVPLGGALGLSQWPPSQQQQPMVAQWPLPLSPPPQRPLSAPLAGRRPFEPPVQQCPQPPPTQQQQRPPSVPRPDFAPPREQRGSCGEKPRGGGPVSGWAPGGP